MVLLLGVLVKFGVTKAKGKVVRLKMYAGMQTCKVMYWASKG